MTGRRTSSRRGSSRGSTRRGTPGRALLPVLLIATTLTVAGGLFVFRQQIRDFLFTRQTHSASQGVLVAITDLAELETLAYVRRTVFPHDFLSTTTDMTTIVGLLSAEGGTPESVLSPAEYRHFRAANLAAEVGLATRREQSSYVVVTTVFRFGYEVEDLIRWYGALTLSTGQEAIDWEDFPVAGILSRDTEDLSRDTYPYGPIPLDAEGWRRVSTFVRDVGPPGPVVEELLEESRRRAIEILQRLTASADSAR